jgi:uncharacterized protein (DUF427 family)
MHKISDTSGAYFFTELYTTQVHFIPSNDVSFPTSNSSQAFSWVPYHGLPQCFVVRVGVEVTQAYASYSFVLPQVVCREARSDIEIPDSKL